MEYTFYDRRVLAPRGFHISKPALSINFKQGRFNLSKELLRIMVLSKGNYIIAAQNPDSPKDWYLCKNKNPNGWELKQYKNGDIAFFCKALANLIKESLDIPDGKKNALFMVSPKPEVTSDHELYFIIPKAL